MLIPPYLSQLTPAILAKLITHFRVATCVLRAILLKDDAHCC